MSSPEEFFARVPRARGAAAPAPASGLGYWRHAWALRHTVLAAGLTVAMFVLFATLTGWPTDPAVRSLLGVAAVLAALIGASYLPPRDTPAASSVCAAGPLLLVGATAILLGSGSAGTGSVLLAALLLLPALGLRVFGPTTCPA